MADDNQTNIAPATEPASPAASSSVHDKRRLPEGVVPKQAQAYVVAGLAVLILMAVMFSKNHSRPAPKEAAPSPLAASTDMNQRKIRELEQDLSADQRQMQQQAAAQRSETVLPPAGTNGTVTPAQPGITTQPAQLPPAASSAAPPRDPVADAEKALAFKARFASNLVTPDEGAARASDESAAVTHNAPARSPSLQQTPTAQPAPAAPIAGSKRPPEVNVNSAHGQPFVVFEGTTIDTVLVNRLDGEFAGPLKVMVTNPVYSQDRQHMLIPEGTFILADVQKVGGLGQKRLAVTFHRMLMPDGYSVDLDQFHGLDQAGATGLKDKVNNHYVEIFGASIALGVIAGAAAHLMAIRLSHYLFCDRKSFKVEIIENESDTPFIATDQPVINLHGNADPTSPPPKQLEFLYPLSPKRAMVFLETSNSIPLRVGELAVNSYNVIMAQHSHEQIFSNSKEYLESFAKIIGGVGSGNRLRSW